MGKCKKAITLWLAAAGIMAMLGAGRVEAAAYDTVYYGGKIYTMTETLEEARKVSNAKTVEVVTVKDGKIVFAGSKAEAQAQGFMDAKTKVDLQGRTMLPGFLDGHGHFFDQGTRDLFYVDLGSPPIGKMKSIEDYKQALKKACDATKDDNLDIVGRGYDDTLVAETKHPTVWDIEEACPGRNVRLDHNSLHMVVVSKSLLNAAGLISDDNYTPTEKAKGLGGVKLTDGKVNGLLMESEAMATLPSQYNAANMRVTPLSPQEKVNRSIARASEVYLAKGVTMADHGASGTTGASGTDGQFQRALDNGFLPLRVALHPLMHLTRINAAGTTYMQTVLKGLNFEGIDITTSQPPKVLFEDANVKPSAKTPKIGADITKYESGLQPYTFTNSVPDNRIFLGAYKILADGSPQGYSAWVKSPGNYFPADFTAADNMVTDPGYETPGCFTGTGALNVKPLDLQYMIRMLHRGGVSTEVHTNGSYQAEAWLEALELAVSDPGNEEVKDTRHTSIHGQMLERQHIERLTGSYATVNPALTTDLHGAFDAGGYKGVNGKSMDQLAGLMKAQNNMASLFNLHVYYFGRRHSDRFFGPGRANNISPAGWADAYGMNYSFHADTDVTPIDPLLNVQTAITRMTARTPKDKGGDVISGTGKNLDATVMLPAKASADATPIPGTEMAFYNYDQRINVLQALRAVTYVPAWQNKLEDRLGSIAEGKLADFVILDQNPIEVAAADPTKIANIRVTTTIVDNKPVFGVLPGAKDFANTVKAASINEVASSTRIDEGTEPMDAETIVNECQDLKQGQTRYAANHIEATVTSDTNPAVAVLQMTLLGNGVSTEKFEMYYRYAGGDWSKYEMLPEFKADKINEAGSHYFWFAEFGDPSSKYEGKLKENERYIVYFKLMPQAIRAAGSNIIADIDLVSNGPAPSNRTNAGKGNSGGGDDDSNGGCTVGTKPGYDMLLLLLVATGLFGYRSMRRRFNA